MTSAPSAPTSATRRARLGEWGRTPRQAAWVIVPPVVAVVLLSAHRWATVPLWRDEYATAMHASLTPSELLRAVTTGDAVQAPYYLLIHALSPLFGFAGGMRLISVLAVAAATAGVALLSLRWWGGVSALAAALFFAVNPSVVIAASTARPYALVLLAIVASFLMAELALSGRRRAWPMYAVAAASAVAMHVISTAALACIALLVLWRGRGAVGRWIAWTVPALCTAAVIAVVGFTQRGQISWLIPPDVRSAVSTLGSTTGLSANRAAVWDAIALMLLASAAGLAIVAARRLPADERPERTRPVLAGLALTFAAPVAMFALSQVAIPVYLDRYLSWTALGAALIVGAVWSVAIVTRGALAVLGAAAAITLSLASIGLNAQAVLEPPPLFDDVPALSETMRGLVEPGDTIVVIETNPHFAVAYAVASGMADDDWADSIRRDIVRADDALGVREIVQTDPMITRTLDGALEQGRHTWLITLGSSSVRDEQLVESEIGCPGAAAWKPVESFGLMHLTRGECTLSPSAAADGDGG